MDAFRQRIEEEVRAGRAREVEVKRDGVPVPGVRVWHVPLKAVRRIWRVHLNAWRVEVGCQWEEETWDGALAEGWTDAYSVHPAAE